MNRKKTDIILSVIEILALMWLLRDTYYRMQESNFDIWNRVFTIGLFIFVIFRSKIKKKLNEIKNKTI